MVEGAPLLREYRVKNSIEGSNPSFSARFYFTNKKNLVAYTACKITATNFVTCQKVSHYAPVAQLDRAPGYELGGREFESLRARHSFILNFTSQLFPFNFSCFLVLNSRANAMQR